MVMEDTYWEGEAPPSYVLGNLANAPSGLLGPMSGVFLLVGLYCVSASQLGSPSHGSWDAASSAAPPSPIRS